MKTALLLALAALALPAAASPIVGMTNFTVAQGGTGTFPALADIGVLFTEQGNAPDPGEVLYVAVFVPGNPVGWHAGPGQDVTLDASFHVAGWDSGSLALCSPWGTGQDRIAFAYNAGDVQFHMQLLGMDGDEYGNGATFAFVSAVPEPGTMFASALALVLVVLRPNLLDRHLARKRYTAGDTGAPTPSRCSGSKSFNHKID